MRCRSPSRVSLDYSHERLVAAAHLLDVNVELGVNVGLEAAVRTIIGQSGTAEQPSGILQGSRVVQLGRSLAAVAVASLQHAREPLPGELWREKRERERA